MKRTELEGPSTQELEEYPTLTRLLDSVVVEADSPRNGNGSKPTNGAITGAAGVLGSAMAQPSLGASTDPPPRA